MSEQNDDGKLESAGIFDMILVDSQVESLRLILRLEEGLEICADTKYGPCPG